MMGYTLQIFVTLCVVLFSCANPQYPHWDHWQPEPPCPPPPCEPLPHHPSPPPHPPLPHWPVEPCGPTHPQWPPCGPLPPPHPPLPHWPVEPCGPTHPQWPPCGPLPPPHPPLPHWPPVEPCAPTPPHWPSPVPPPPHPSPPLPHWPPVEPCAPTPPHWPTPVPPPPHPSPPLPHCPPVEPCDPTPPHWPTPVPHPSPHLPHFPPVEPCAPTPPHWPAPVPLPPHPSPPSPHWPPVEPCAPAPPHWPAPVPLPPHPSPPAPHWPPVEPCGPTSPHWPAPVPHWPPVEPCASTPPHWPAPVTPPSHPSPHWPPVQPCAPTPSHWPAPCAPHWPVPEPCSPPCPHWYGSVPSIPPPPEDPEVFPREFSFGVGSGPYQIEGAWQQDYAGESIIDRWIHSNPGVIADHSNGDCSADAYNHIDEDVAILRNLNVRHYRFGISWPRIIPTGYGHVNQAAIDHYRYLINLLKCNHIEPIVTIYHGDLPQVLQDQGGFLCSSFIDWYTEYARVLFENFGNDVKYWITFNNPVDICKGGYQDGKSAPGYTESPPNNAYRCGHNLLLAHAAVYHLYDDYYRPTQQGKISIALRSDWYEPASDCEDDHIAAENKLQFQIGWFANPIYNGDYPDIMKDRIAVRSQLAGLCESRLPVFTHHEIEYIKNTHDFFSLGYLSVSYCSLRTETVYYSESCHDDIGAEVVSCQGDDTPGIRKLIQWISENYHNPAIFIVSNGVGTTTRCLEDWDRIDYIQRILRQIRQAQLNTCARVYAYTYYSYIDGFEHTAGYTLKYGLYDVEFDCPYKTRTPRQSALYYQGLCRYGHI